MLQAQGKYNNISQKLRTELEEVAKSAGRFIKYKFSIARINPDGEQKTGGKYLYPLVYTVTPVTYDIVDPYDKTQKRIALVQALKEFGAPSDSFRRVKLKEGWQGIYTLDMNKIEDRDMFAYLEMHPKMENGRFRDTEQPAMISRIDEKAKATEQLRIRKLKVDAMYVASNMTTQEVRDFASAAGWNEFEDENILVDRITQIAEEKPEFFRDFIDNKNIGTRAILQRAIDNNIIAFLPVESRLVWVATGQTIAVLERADNTNLLERLCDWVLVSKNGPEVFAKIKDMLQERNKVVQ